MRGQPADGPITQPRQLPTVAARQIPTRQSDLLFDQIEIVEQPGFCWHELLILRGCGGHNVVRRQQHARIVRQSWQQLVPTRMWVDVMLASQRYCVALQLLDAEKFRAQRLGFLIITQRISCAWRKSEFFDVDDIFLVLIRGS